MMLEYITEKVIMHNFDPWFSAPINLMEEELINFTGGCGLMRDVNPFWHVQKLFFCIWYEIKTLQVVRLAFLV